MADSKLKTVRRSSTTTSTITDSKRKEVPKGATIIDKTVRTETEEIENGFLISKNYDVTYELKGERNYAYFTRKWYSKEDPLEISIKDQALADAFEEE